MKTVERHKKTDFGDVWYVNAADGTYRFAVYKYDDDNDTIYLSNVFVKEDSRRQGYGNEILTSAEEYANRLGASVICLKVLSGTDVHRWYKRHGYEDLEKDEEERGYMWMKKELRKINESVWSDMHKRSDGRAIRKEDDIPFGMGDVLLTYIGMFSDKLHDTDDYELTLGDFISFIRDFSDDERVKSFNPDIPGLITYVKAHWDDSVSQSIQDTVNDIDMGLDNISGVDESVWSDMHKRSNGYQVRKEDDVNLLDLDEFYKYIKDQYKTKVEYIDLDAMGGGNGNVLGVDITEDIILFYKPKRGHILLSWSRVKIPMPFLDELADRFKIENPNVMRRIITEKDGSCTNKTFVDVIEFFLGHKESMVNESVWADIHKRSNGSQERKEDDLNILGPDDFFSYLVSEYRNKTYYISKDHYCRDYDTDVVVNPIRDIGVFGSYSDDKLSRIMVVLTNRGYIRHHQAINNMLKLSDDRFIWDKGDEERFYVTGKNGDVNNITFVDLIEFFLNNSIYESVCVDMHKRSNGEQVRKEDEITQTDMDAIVDSMNEFATRVVWDNEKFSREKFCECIRNYLKFIEDINIENIIRYVNLHWTGDIEKDIEGFIKEEEKEKDRGMNESIWSDIHRRSNGEQVRKEDELTSDDYTILKEVLIMFGREVRFAINNNYKILYKNTLEDCVKFINVLIDSDFRGVDLLKLKKYVETNWEKDPIIQKIIGWTIDGKKSKEIDQEIRNEIKNDKTWNLNECDGVPGGITPADVGGMGEITFPGADGTPGSGDIPMPTGHVYQQVAPFGIFIRAKKGKKRKKKFRKEDEPCVHSENPPIYSHVDDFRDYVDRVYNQIDRKK